VNSCSDFTGFSHLLLDFFLWETHLSHLLHSLLICFGYFIQITITEIQITFRLIFIRFVFWIISVGSVVGYLSYVVYYIDIIVYSLLSSCFSTRSVARETIGICFSSSCAGSLVSSIRLWLGIGFYVSGTRVLIVVTSTSSWIRLSTRLRNQRLVISWSEVLQPWISPQFLGRWSVLSFVLHASRDYSSGARWHMVWDGQVTSLYFAVQVFIVLSSKRKLATKESKEQDSTCIYICRWSTIFRLLDYFWSHVRRRSTEHFDPLIIWNACAESKIYQFDISSLVQHHIF